MYNNKRANADARESIVEKDTMTHPETRLPMIDPSTLLGRTFINNPDENGEQVRAKIDGIEFTGKTTPDWKQELFHFRSRVGEKTFKSIMTYNKVVEWCNRDLDKDNFFWIDGIVGHKKDKDAGCGHLVLVQRADRTSTWNDLGMTFQDDPITVLLYAQKNGLLDTPGWKDCKQYIHNSKKLACMINQARLKTNHTKPVYKYGFHYQGTMPKQ